MDIKSSLKKYWSVIVIVLLVILLVLEALYIFRAIKTFSSEGELQIAHLHDHDHMPITQPRIDMIQTWMTFDYINVVFALPPTYLKDTLKIQDAQYPNIRLDSYAHHHDLNAQTLLQHIQQAVASYKTAR